MYTSWRSDWWEILSNTFLKIQLCANGTLSNLEELRDTKQFVQRQNVVQKKEIYEANKNQKAKRDALWKPSRKLGRKQAKSQAKIQTENQAETKQKANKKTKRKTEWKPSWNQAET